MVTEIDCEHIRTGDSRRESCLPTALRDSSRRSGALSQLALPGRCRARCSCNGELFSQLRLITLEDIARAILFPLTVGLSRRPESRMSSTYTSSTHHLRPRSRLILRFSSSRRFTYNSFLPPCSPTPLSNPPVYETKCANRPPFGFSHSPGCGGRSWSRLPGTFHVFLSR